MKNHFRLSPILFAGVQLMGLVCMCTWQSAPRMVASFLWGTAIIALFPGNFLSAVLIEKLFWKTELSPMAMLVTEIPVLIALNAAAWFGLIKTIRLFQGHAR